MKKMIYLLPFLLLFGCVSEDEYNEVLMENKELMRDLKIQEDLVLGLKNKNNYLLSEFEITKMLLEECNDKIYGDAFVLTRSGTSGYIRLEGYEEAVEYLKDCCY